MITIRAIVDSILTVDLISLLYFKYALTMDLISLLQQLALSSLSIDNILSIDCLSKYCNNIFNILREPYLLVPIERPFTTPYWDLNLSDRNFLLYPAGQL